MDSKKDETPRIEDRVHKHSRHSRPSVPHGLLPALPLLFGLLVAGCQPEPVPPTPMVAEPTPQPGRDHGPRLIRPTPDPESSTVSNPSGHTDPDDSNASDPLGDTGSGQPNTPTPESLLPPTPYPGPSGWAEGELPPDPALVAPPIDMSVATTLDQAIRFLYTGYNPVQRGVTPGAILPERAALVVGRLLDRDGYPLPGVTVSVRNHPEYGSTRSREDGRFDLAVNGGDSLLVNFEFGGFLPVQRRVRPHWQRSASLPDIVLTPLDAQATWIDFTQATRIDFLEPFQVARGSVSSDEAGTRQATLLFPQGLEVTALLPTGEVRPLPAFTVRATEYTVGAYGPAAMPGDLPAASAYTYAVELSIDEAQTLGARTVNFSQPVEFYVENFLGFKIGTPAPLGWYDPEQDAWIPAESGRVVELLSVEDGLAVLDVDGYGRPASSRELEGLGISDEELETLATLYAPGQSLWRVRLPHFTSWDINWGWGPPSDAVAPGQDQPKSDSSQCNPCQQSGSIIEVQNQILGERVPIPGTGFSLNYRSDRTPGRIAAYTLEIPLSGDEVPASLKRIELEVQVAGREFSWRFEPSPGQTYTFTWDGLDEYGRRLQGSQPVTGRIGYVYDGVYEETSTFGYNGNGTEITGDPTLMEVTIWQSLETTLGAWDASGLGLGGWTLDVHHGYDPNSRRLYLGDGRRRDAFGLATVMLTVAGGGMDYNEGGQALDAFLGYPAGLATDGQGNLYITDFQTQTVRRLGPDGRIVTVAGTVDIGGRADGDGGPATEATLWNPYDVAVGPEGALYIADARNNRIRRVDPDGTITTVVGDGDDDHLGDGGPATEAGLSWPYGVAVDDQGTLYIADTYHNRIRRVAPDGTITTLAGNGAQGFRGDGGPATLAQLNMPYDLTLEADGSLVVADGENSRVRRIGVNGIIETVAGRGGKGSTGDGGPAVLAEIGVPDGLVVDRDGALFIADSWNSVIRKVWPDGTITTVAGHIAARDEIDSIGESNPPESEPWSEGGPATSAFLDKPWGLAIDELGNLLIADTSDYIIESVGHSLPPYTGDPLLLTSAEGDEIYRFDASGRHLETLDALTGIMLYQFRYDSSFGLLSEIEDTAGNITRIERDGQGYPTAIIGPWGQGVRLEVDNNGYLTGIMDGEGNTTGLVHGQDGLLEGLVDPNGMATATKGGGIHSFFYDAQGRLEDDIGPQEDTISLSRLEDETGYDVLTFSPMGRQRIYRTEQRTAIEQTRYNTGSDGLTIEGRYSPDEETVIQPDGTRFTQWYGPDPRLGMAAPYRIGAELELPSGLTARLEATRAVVLEDPDDPLSLIRQTDTVVSNGRTWVRTIDTDARTVTLTSPEDRTSTLTLDELGRPIELNVPGLDPVSAGYDGKGRLSGFGQGVRSLFFGYGADGYLKTLDDPAGATWTREHDGAGRLVSSTLADGQEIGFAYDASGNLVGLTPPGRPVHALGYTPRNQLERYSPPALDGYQGDTGYDYDADRFLTAVRLPDGRMVERRHDPQSGRLTDIVWPEGRVSLGYDQASGRVESLSNPDTLLTLSHDGPWVTGVRWTGAISGAVSFTFNADLALETEAVNESDVLSFGYDGDGLLTRAGQLRLERDSANGLLAGSTLGQVQETIVRNGYGETSQSEVRFGGSSLFTIGYERDTLGRIATRSEIIEGTTHIWGYEYDATGRLVQVTRDGAVAGTYAYDANGNRLSGMSLDPTATPVYDDQDRLIACGAVRFSYDGAGALSTKTDERTGEATTYRYDALGQLLEAGLPDGTLIEYVLDGANRRIGRRVDGVLEKGWLYRDNLAPVAELDGEGHVVSRFVYASRTTVPDYMVREGTTYRIVADEVGSPRLVVNVLTSEIIQQIDYDAWGRVTRDTHPGFQPFGFAGGLYDEDTGLVRFGARDYDPGTGRWTAKDPILFAGHDSNLYGYVFGDPVNRVDPEGLATIQVGISATFGGGVGGTLGGGLAFAWGGSAGFQWGFYGVTGAGGYGGIGGGVTGDVTFSRNDCLESLRGPAGTIGGSVGEVQTVGAEVNLMRGADPSYTFSYGLGAEALLPIPVPAELHGFITYTGILEMD